MTWILRLIGVTILLVFLQAFFFRKVGLHSISIRRRFSSRFAFEGDSIQLLEEISNDKPIPVPLLVVESRINRNIEMSAAVELDVNDSNYHRSLFTLLPFTKVTRKHHITLAKRGHYDLKSVVLSTYDMMGFSKVVADDVPVDAVVTVYPKLLDLQDASLPCHSFLGDAIVRRWILDDPFLKAGVRGYHQSDPLRMINWKASARTGSLQVNKLDFTADTKLMIIFNVDLQERQWYAPTDTRLLEYSLSLCASYAKLALDHGMEVGLLSNGSGILTPDAYTEIPTGAGDQHLYAILEALALLQFKHIYSFHYFLHQIFKSGIHDHDILLLTPYVDDQIQNETELLRYAGNAVEIILPEGGGLREQA